MMWLARLPPRPSGARCLLDISNGLEEIILEDILFGDVWFCSGQSNMGWVLGGIENRTEEMEDAEKYTNIRFYHTQDMAASEPQEDLSIMRTGWDRWADPLSEWPEGTEWSGGH